MGGATDRVDRSSRIFRLHRSTLQRSRLQNVPTRYEACVGSSLSFIFWLKKLTCPPAWYHARAGGRRRVVDPLPNSLGFRPRTTTPGTVKDSVVATEDQTSRCEQEPRRTSVSSEKLPAFRPKAVLPIPEGRRASAVAIRQVVRTFLGGARNTFLFHRISPSFPRSSFEPELASLLIAPPC